jgi:hypothetical protein
MDEALSEVSAAQMAAEFVLDVARPRPTVRLACIPHKLRAVVLDEPIEDSLMWLSRTIAG